MRTAVLFAALTLLAAASPAPAPTVFHADDMMDSPRPKAQLSQWSDAPGRSRITLAVPGALLRGYAYTGANPKGPVLLMFGGSGNLIERHDAAAHGFARHASAVIWYDYRGYGFSTGTAHFETLRSDALRIFDAVDQQHPGAKIVVLGYSMGTSIADYVAIHRDIAGVILAAPWDDIMATLAYQDAKHHYELTPQARTDFDETEMVRHISAPLLVFQGTRDNAIPPTQGAALERVAPSTDKHFVPIQGAKHNGLLEQSQSQAAVAAFLATF
jgi:uncharacterized protein